eukprot:CAMPEP_0117673322 /NCGR_PEP_ID=MMETSP0804-20121206/14408_1 /TAXON_ID=1074897 /ORGANISM="Tetraselmis astigmatica, Strain CCMP880" /LENGTH=170 /DNA_ID=CAMNT_0005482047 /DNA_START=106 /DNA_END=619 /DNA_ORIENTATION=+
MAGAGPTTETAAAGGGGWSAGNLQFMELAIEQARKAGRQLEVPVGCVIVEDGCVIGSGHNTTNRTRNGTRHAELEAIDEILASRPGQGSQLDLSRCTLYVTCEPCIMCAGACPSSVLAGWFTAAAMTSLVAVALFCGSMRPAVAAVAGATGQGQPSLAKADSWQRKALNF